MKEYYVYILSNKLNGVLYIGVTSDIIKRVWQHKQKIIKGFTTKYNLDKLVYFEQFNDINYAINREKRLKEYKRKWELDLIEANNPNWHDLYYKIILIRSRDQVAG
ncbi:MAG TPA: GIY-YIG nuclease family protein [Rickettsia endosymbiont of Bembidion nr. Transversale]|nr:GIY-YIG nuclease family protein [Rickettsia endosymbiont of Bembidion nr. Transversale]